MPQVKRKWYERIFKKIKVYKDEGISFTKTERLVMAKLYLCPYQKTFFSLKTGSYDEIINEINKEKNFSYPHLRRILKRFVEEGILKIDKLRLDEEYTETQTAKFYIEKKELEKHLEVDWIYKLYLKLFKKQYMMIKQ